MARARPRAPDARPRRARGAGEHRARDREAVRRRGSRVRSAGAPGGVLRLLRARGRGDGAARRGHGGRLQRRGRGDHGRRRHLLPAPQRMRADRRRAARRAVDVRRGELRRAQRLRPRVDDVPHALRRDPRRDRAMAGGRGAAADRAAPVRAQLPRDADVPARPPGRAAGAPGKVRGGQAPARRQRVAPPGATVAGGDRAGAARSAVGRGHGRAVPLGDLEALAAGSRNDRARAYAAFAAGRVRRAEHGAGAVADLQAALEGFAGLDLPFEAGRARLHLARAIAAEAPDAAEAEARLALREFERLGTARYADEAAGLLRELGATGRVWPKAYGTLTKRETEVLALLAEGLSNADLAERLVISPRTAEHHVSSILSKLGLRSRAEAAAHALLEPPVGPVAG